MRSRYDPPEPAAIARSVSRPFAGSSSSTGSSFAATVEAKSICLASESRPGSTGEQHDDVEMEQATARLRTRFEAALVQVKAPVHAARALKGRNAVRELRWRAYPTTSAGWSSG